MLFILLVLSAIAYSESASCQRPVCRLDSATCAKLTEKQTVFENRFKDSKFAKLVVELYDNSTTLTIAYGAEEGTLVGNTIDEQIQMYQKISQFFFGYTVLKFHPIKVFAEGVFIVVEGTFKLENPESKGFVAGKYYQKFTQNFVTVVHWIEATEKDGQNIFCNLESAACTNLAEMQSFFERSFREGKFKELTDTLYNNQTILTINYGNGEAKSVGTTKEEQIVMYQKIAQLYNGYLVLKFFTTKVFADGQFYVVEGTFSLGNVESGSYIGGKFHQKYTSGFVTVEHLIEATTKNGHSINCKLDSKVCKQLDKRQNFFENSFKNQTFEAMIAEMYTKDTVLTISYGNNEEDSIGKSKQEQIAMYEKINKIYPGYTLLTFTPTKVSSEGEFYNVMGTFKLEKGSSFVSGVYSQKFNSEFKTVEHKIEATESQEI